MKLTIGDVKKVACACSVLFFLVGVHVLSVYIFAIHKFAITYDPLLSAQASYDIDRYVNNRCRYGLQFEQLDDDLRKTFACIAGIAALCRPDGVVELAVQAVAPIMKLNEVYAVTLNNDVVPLDYYTQQSTQELVMLRIALQDNQKHLPQIAFDYVQKINESFANSTTVVWKHSNEIHISYDDHNVQCICNAYITPDEHLLDRCVHIAHEINMKSPSVLPLLADIRFNDQIVISRVAS